MLTAFFGMNTKLRAGLTALLRWCNPAPSNEDTHSWKKFQFQSLHVSALSPTFFSVQCQQSSAGRMTLSFWPFPVSKVFRLHSPKKRIITQTKLTVLQDGAACIYYLSNKTISLCCTEKVWLTFFEPANKTVGKKMFLLFFSVKCIGGEEFIALSSTSTRAKSCVLFMAISEISHGEMGLLLVKNTAIYTYSAPALPFAALSLKSSPSQNKASCHFFIL